MKSTNLAIPDTSAAAPQPPAAHAAAELAEVILMSADQALIELLGQALEGHYRVREADSAAHAVDLVVAAGNAILLLDASLADQDSHALVLQLNQQFPDAAIIVAGRRDDEARLSKLISEGQVFRFLHKPASAERIRNFVDAALRRQAERQQQEAAEGRDGSLPRLPEFRLPTLKLDPARLQRFKRRALVPLVLAGIVALLATLQPWQHLGAPSQVTTAGVVAPASTVGDPALLRLLDAAGMALAQGRLVAPPDRNAADLYRAALRLDPGNRRAHQGLDRVSERLFETAEQALMAGDLAVLATTLEAARSVRPDHPRLEFLSAQLLREREWAEASRVPAGNASRAAGQPELASSPRPANDRVQGLVLLANERIANNRLAGDSDSAQAYLLAARRLDAADPALQQALAALGVRLQLGAREALTQGRREDAEQWLQHLAALDLDSAEVAALRSDIEAARLADQREERARLLMLANQRIAQGRLTEPQADSARHYLDLLRAADPAFPGLADTTALLAETTLAESRRMAGTGQPAAAAAAKVIPETGFRRTRFVPPQYPQRALERGVEGWVDLEFTIGADGTPGDLTVMAARPEATFNQAALDAVARWRYEPQPAGQRVSMRVNFKLAD